MQLFGNLNTEFTMTTTLSAGTVRMEQTQEFKDLCALHGVQPTRRQYSKFTNGYGALARATGKSTRKAPPGK